MNNTRFVIIVPFYNASKYIERCVSSIMTQRYDNFRVIFIDDNSSDNSWDFLPHEDNRATCIRNTKNVKALKNIHEATMSCSDDVVVILVDGDDSLLNKNVLRDINDIYQEGTSSDTNCWLQYGQFMFSTGGVGFAREYTDEEFKNLRTAPFKVSHIRSYKVSLYKKIKEQDPEFSCLKNENGEFFEMTYDFAIFIVLLEMAQKERVKFNPKPLYLYNFENPISDHVLDQNKQTSIHIELSKRKPFRQIFNL